MDPQEHPEAVDWGDQLDDYGSEYWENYLGGPDEGFFEPEYQYEEDLAAEEAGWAGQEPEHGDQQEEFRDEVDAPNDQDKERPEASPQRRDAIVQWLAQSELARGLRSGDGFYVLRGKFGRLQDGETVEILAWLEEEGIKAGTLAGGYSVSYTPPGGTYLEKLTFFRVAQGIPFRSLTPSSSVFHRGRGLPF